MLLAREFVTYLSRQLTSKLQGGIIEIANPAAVMELIEQTITSELTVEDRLNDEVRECSSSTAFT